MLDLTVRRNPFRWGEDVLVLFNQLIYLSLFHRGNPYRGIGGYDDFIFSFNMYHEENKPPSLRDCLPAFINVYINGGN